MGGGGGSYWFWLRCKEIFFHSLVTFPPPYSFLPQIDILNYNRLCLYVCLYVISCPFTISPFHQPVAVQWTWILNYKRLCL